MSITKFRMVAPRSQRTLHDRGTLVQYGRFVDVQQRRARITAELTASLERVTCRRLSRSADRVFDGDDAQRSRTEPRS